MRINKFVARATGFSRRAADQTIREGRVTINRRQAGLGDTVADKDSVTLDNKPLKAVEKELTIMLNKPAGYVCSRQGQGSRTVYDLLPPEYYRLKPVGRLDKNSSGLLLLTDDGELANQLTHPRYLKTKIYEITLDKLLAETDRNKIEQGVTVDDYISRISLSAAKSGLPSPAEGRSWRVSMSQGHNRQIRRTFAALGYEVQALHRVQFGTYRLNGLQLGSYKELR